MGYTPDYSQKQTNMDLIEETVVENIEEALKTSLSYGKYKDLISALLEKGESTTKGGSEALVPYTEMNVRRMDRWDRRFEVDPSLVDKIEKAPAQTWIVLTEGWCGDAAHCVPVMQKIAAVNPQIDLRLVLRDSNEALMNDFLTNGSKSIPKLIMYDPETKQVKNTWGPRPDGAAEIFESLRGEDFEEINTALQKWYNQDKGRSAAAEIVELL